MRRILLIGRSESGKTTLKQVLRGENITDNPQTNKKFTFIRYADDWLVGVCGTKEECALEKMKLQHFYRAHFSSRPEVAQLVSEYIDFYNFERISLKNGLTPVEIRSKAA